MLGISENCISKAFEFIKNYKIRGASLIDINTTERLEKDKHRGVRVSRIQMDKKTKDRILRKIRKLSSTPQRVIEAITIASKVAYLNEIIAEICISDNPDYTTGYIASRNFGYLRITNIKNQGDDTGGRVFFCKISR
jgi:6-carboxyhexanoate--CoA ligase